MKLIEPKAELLIQPNGLEGIYKQIEICGRTCYRSEDKITEDSAKPFVERMIKSGHTAMLEHGTVYLAIPYTDEEALSHYRGVAGKYNEVEFTRYSKVTMMRGTHNYVTTNYRVLVENNWLDDLQYLCSHTEFHEKRYTMKFTTDRGVMAELTRHRAFSFAVESTRYCNYSRNKFDNEITFVSPSWLNLNKGKYQTVATNNEIQIAGDGLVKGYYDKDKEATFLRSCLDSESDYMNLIDEGCSPQEARQILPNALKTEVCMTGFASDWRFFFDLRLFAKTGNPHPNMLLLAQKMKAEAEDKDVWNDIMRYHSKF